MDVLHDNSFRTFYQIANAHEAIIPAYVMDSILSKEASAELPDRQFADDIGRMFPLDSKAAVWLSAAYFAKSAAEYRPVMRGYISDSIEKAAEIFGISDDVKKITDAIRSEGVVKQAAATDDDFGWLEKNDNGDIVARKYPMFDAEGVKLACQHFVENRSKYPGEMRRTIAQNIMKKAEQFGLETVFGPDGNAPVEVRKEACIGMPRRDVLMAELLERAHLTKDAELSVVLANLNELVATQPMDQLMPELPKIASIVEDIDSTTGLDRHYGVKVLAPQDFIFEIDVKVAAELADDTVELNKYMFSLKKLASLEPSIYGDCLGDDFVTRISDDGKISIEKLADELFSLPKPDRAALERHLQTSLK